MCTFQLDAVRRCDSSASQLSWLRHRSAVHHITCLDNLCFPYADDSTATTPTIDVIFGGTAPYFAGASPYFAGTAPYFGGARRSSSRSANFFARQSVQPLPPPPTAASSSSSTRPGFTFARNRREPTHFQWFGVAASSKPTSQFLQLPPSAVRRLVSRTEYRTCHT